MTIDVLIAKHHDFLQYAHRRTGDRALAEDIVQDAFVRSLERGADVCESVVGWFFRVVRNAVVDWQRRTAAAERRLDRFAAEVASDVAFDVAFDDDTCFAGDSVMHIVLTLKPEYADALQRIEIDGIAVQDYAAAVGISASNAGVRVFRARKALRKQLARVSAESITAQRGCA